MTLKELKALMERVIEDTDYAGDLESTEIIFMQYDACDEKAVFDVCDALGNEMRYTYTISELLENEDQGLTSSIPSTIIKS